MKIEWQRGLGISQKTILHARDFFQKNRKCLYTCYACSQQKEQVKLFRKMPECTDTGDACYSPKLNFSTWNFFRNLQLFFLIKNLKWISKSVYLMCLMSCCLYSVNWKYIWYLVGVFMMYSDVFTVYQKMA